MAIDRSIRFTGRAAIVAAMVGGLGLACGDAGFGPEEGGSFQLALTPQVEVIEDGDSATVQVVIRDRAGNPVDVSSRYQVRWISGDTEIVNVSAAGSSAVLRAESAGETAVAVEAEPVTSDGSAPTFNSTLQSSFRIRISQRPVALEVQSGGGQPGIAGRTLTSPVSIRLIDRKGKGVMGQRVDFLVTTGNGSLMPASGTTDINGLVSTMWTLGPHTGEHTLKVTSPRVSDLVVTATASAAAAASLTTMSGSGQQGTVGQPLAQALRVRLIDENGGGVAGAAVTWSASGGGTVAGDAATTDSAGYATARWTLGQGAGAQTARASAGVLNADFSANAASGPAAQLVRVSGDAQTGTVGSVLTSPLVIRVEDAFSNPVAGATVSWSVTAGGGSVSPAQSMTNGSGTSSASWTLGSAAGTGSVRASVAGAGNVTFTSSASSTSTPPPPPSVARVTLTPATLALDAIGAQGSLTAVAYDGSNQVVANAAFSWTSLNPSLATVDTTGRVTARGIGTVLIVAASVCCGHADTTAVTITQRVASLAVAPRTLSLQTGASGDLTVTARDANGNVIASPGVSWGSSNTAVATVAQGRVSGAGAGTAVVRAVSGTVRDSATVTVEAPAQQVSRVVVTPENASLTAIGAQVALSALAYDANNQVVLNAVVQWRTLNSSIATVDTMGRVTARGIGTALIVGTAVCCSQADTTAVAVSQRVASLDVTPASVTLNVGGSQVLSVTAVDANNNPISSPSINWSSSATGVATVSNGQVTAVAAGTAVIRAAAGDGRDSTIVTVSSTSPPPQSPALDTECSTPQSAWIWCDDFSTNRLTSYFEYDNAGGRFVRENAVGVNGTTGMRATFNAGESNAGSLKLAFGATPSSYFRAVDAGTARYREVYWRVFIRNAPDWTGGGGDKLSRAVVFANSNWAEAAIGHVWSGGTNHNFLMVDPASGTDTQGTLRTTRYNDFPNLRWLGARVGTTPIFSSANVGQWRCVETRMRLNDAGQSNGVFELWIDGRLEAQSNNLNWLGSYSAYGINALFLENFWNNGSPRQQSRFFDNLVVSTQPIGCGSGGTSPPPPPPPAPVASVAVTPTSASLTVGATQQLTTTLRDAGGNTLTGRTVSWSSSNTNVATVASGVVTARAAGSTTITATSENVSGTSSITVTSSSGSPAPVLVEDFSTYTSTSHFLSDPRGIYNRVEDFNTSRMQIESGVGYGGSNQSLRYNYPGGTATDFTISRNLRLHDVQEVWVEAVVRFSAEFTFDGNGQGYSQGMKLLHVNIWPDGNGRFALDMLHGDEGNLSMQGPSDAYESFFRLTSASNATLMDGNWHVLRYHVRLTGTKMHELWVDGAYMGSRTGSTSADRMWGISLAKNINMVAAHPMHMWWGRVSYWTTNPGW